MPPIIGSWYGQKFWRHRWVFAAHYIQLTLHAICMMTLQSLKGIRMSLRATVMRNCASGNILKRRFPDSAPHRALAICRIAAFLTYGELYTSQTPRPILLRLLQAAA